MIQHPHNAVAAVAPDGTFFTVFANGVLEIRGKEWERYNKEDIPAADRPRICRLDTSSRAKRIAERVARLSCGLPETAGDYKLVQNLQDLPPGVFMATLKLTSGNQPVTRTIKILRNQ